MRNPAARHFAGPFAQPEKVAEKTYLVIGIDPEIFTVFTHPAAGFAGDNFSRMDLQARSAPEDTRRILPCLSAGARQHHGFGGAFVVDYHAPVVAEKAFEVPQRMKKLAGQFAVEQYVGVFGFAVDGKKAYDLPVKQ